jgi:hypothetical protein
MLDEAVKIARSNGGKDESCIRSAFELLQDVDSDIFLQFLDKTGLLSRKEMLFFWQSEYCIKHAKALLTDLRGTERLVAYFSKNEHANGNFIRAVFEINPLLLYNAARMSSIYDRDNHIVSLSFLSISRDSQLRILFKELSFLNGLWHRWLKDEIFYRSILCQYSYSEILVHFTSYYEKWKRSAPEALNNKTLNADMEVTLLNVLDMMLNAKQQENVEDDPLKSNELDLSSSKKLLVDALPPLNPPEGILKNKYLPNEEIDLQKKLIRETIRFYFDFHQFYHYANMYSGGYADFEYIDEIEGELLTNPTWFEWRRNDFKARQLKDLMHRSVIDKLDEHSFAVGISPPEREVQIGTTLDEENWHFLALCPKLFNENREEIDAWDCFALLRTLSKVLKPSGRNIAYSMDDGTSHVMKQEFPEKWLLFSEPSYLAMFETDDFSNKLSSILGWEKDRTTKVLSLLTTDLNSSQSISVEGRPFLKSGGLVFWLSTFYSDREWYQLFLASVQTDRNIRFGCKRNHTAELEIEKYFVDAGFKAKAEYELKSQSGDIVAVPDVLAFRDNTLFVIEYKLSHYDSDVSKAGRQQVKVFDFLAKTQITTTESWLRNNLDLEVGSELRQLLGIKCAYSALTIVPIIVTNNFEHDGLLIDKRIRTTTLYELSVILRNNLYDNLHAPFEKMAKVYHGKLPTEKSEKADEFMLSFDFIHRMSNSRNPFVKEDAPREYSKAECDLWEGKKECSAKRFLNIIDKELVWKFLDQSYRYGELIRMKMVPFHRQNSDILY